MISLNLPLEETRSTLSRLKGGVHKESQRSQWSGSLPAFKCEYLLSIGVVQVRIRGPQLTGEER